MKLMISTCFEYVIPSTSYPLSPVDGNQFKSFEFESTGLSQGGYNQTCYDR